MTRVRLRLSFTRCHWGNLDRVRQISRNGYPRRIEDFGAYGLSFDVHRSRTLLEMRIGQLRKPHDDYDERAPVPELQCG